MHLSRYKINEILSFNAIQRNTFCIKNITIYLNFRNNVSIMNVEHFLIKCVEGIN